MLNWITAFAIIVIILAYLLYMILKKRKQDKKRCGYILVPCTEITENLEQIVKAYYWEETFENEKYCRDILLVQMEKSSKYYLSKMLEQKYSCVKCVDISELVDYLKKKEYQNNENHKCK